MSYSQLLVGVFEEIGDTYVLQLSAITGVTSFTSYSDVTTNETATRLFVREFSYSVNGGIPSAWQSLTNPNLASIVVSSPSDVYMFRIRYTRSGADDTNVLIWDSFCLNNIQVTPCLVVRTNRTNWDLLYGSYKFIELNNQIIRFNDEWSMPKFGLYVYLNDDASVPDKHIYVTLMPDAICQDIDVNVILKALWGNYLVDYHFQIRIDLWDGVRS